MKKNLIIVALVAMALAPLANAQKLDKNSLGSITLSGYPQVPIRLNQTSFALADEQNRNVGYELYTNGLWNSSKRVQNTKVVDGADIIVRYSGVIEQTSPIEVVKEAEVYDYLLRHGKHPQKVKVIEKRFQAFGYKTLAFYVDVSTDDGLVYSDSMYKVKEYASDLCRDPKRAIFLVDSMYKRDAAKDNMYAFSMKNEAQKVNHGVSKMLGFIYMDSYRFHVYSVKAKKKEQYDYSDLIAAATNFETAAKIVDKNDFAIDDFKTSAASSLEIWQNALAKTNDPRLSSEAKAAINYNMGTYYVLVKDFDRAADYYSAAQKLQPNFADTEKLLKTVKTWSKAKNRYDNMMFEFEASKNK